MVVVEQKLYKPVMYPHDAPEVRNYYELIAQLPIVGMPIQNLWGRQLPSEYTSHKFKAIDRHLKEEGISYLLRYPIVTVKVLCRAGNPMDIIYDGHHRARRAPRYGIHVIPAVSMSMNMCDGIFGEGYAHALINQACEAQAVFQSLMEHHRH